MKNVYLIDTTFLRDLFLFTRKKAHEDAVELYKMIDDQSLIIPTAVLSETLNSEFVSDEKRLIKFETFLKRKNVKILNDTEYYQDGIDLMFTHFNYQYKRVSYTDAILLLILEDVQVRINGLISSNIRDFADLCRRKGIEMYP